MSIKISELGDSAELNGVEYVPIVQNGATVKTSTKDIAGLIGIDYTPENVANKSANTSLGTSDTLYPTQNAVKTYVDSATTSLVRDRGNYDASSNQFPITGMGSGASGAIMSGDLWYISVAGTLGGISVLVGYSIRALVTNPGQNASNWGILNVGLGYVPENIANKSNNTALGTSVDLYPTQNAVKAYVDAHSNGLTSVGIALSTTSNGGDLSVTNSPLTSNGNISINIPNASAIGSGIRGVVSTADQSFKGIKTFDKIKSGGIQLDITTSEYSNTGFATLWSPNTSGFNVLNIKTSSASTSSLKMPNTGSYTYTYPANNGTVALASNLSSYVTITSLTSTGDLNIIGNTLSVKDNIYGSWGLYSKTITAEPYLTIKDGKDNDRILISGLQGSSAFENAIIVQGSVGAASQKSKLLFTTTASDYNYTFPNASGTLVVGSGTAGYLQRMSDTTSLVDSQIYDDGTSVVVGGASPNSSAKLQIDSTTQGFLPPRMTGLQANSISSKAEGLLVYATSANGTISSKGWWGWDGSAWQKLG
jgi:hypothetical protein